MINRVVWDSAAGLRFHQNIRLKESMILLSNNARLATCLNTKFLRCIWGGNETPYILDSETVPDVGEWWLSYQSALSQESTGENACWTDVDMAVFCFVMPCSLVKVFRRFKGSKHL